MSIDVATTKLQATLSRIAHEKSVSILQAAFLNAGAESPDTHYCWDCDREIPFHYSGCDLFDDRITE